MVWKLLALELAAQTTLLQEKCSINNSSDRTLELIMLMMLIIPPQRCESVWLPFPSWHYFLVCFWDEESTNPKSYVISEICGCDEPKFILFLCIPYPMGVGKVCPPMQTPSPWAEGMTHSCENITLPQTSFAGGKKQNVMKCRRLKFTPQVNGNCLLAFWLIIHVKWVKFTK